MNEKLRYFLISMVIPLILIALGVFGIGGLLIMIVGAVWLGLSLMIFYPIEES
jgi:uncharacterized integral membrane protein